MLDIGRQGEELAVRHLRSAGCLILSRNWRAGRREIDIVVREGATVAFVEVKTRRDGPQHPLDAVSRDKRRNLRLAAQHWIATHRVPASEYRFDVVGVTISRYRPPRIHHVREAFTGDFE